MTAKNPHAVALGALGGKVGGKVTSYRKTAANRRNARKPRPSRYCGMCDAWVRGKACPKCGADTDKGAK